MGVSAGDGRGDDECERKAVMGTARRQSSSSSSPVLRSALKSFHIPNAASTMAFNQPTM